mgnify:CR=1 FL=1
MIASMFDCVVLIETLWNVNHKYKLVWYWRDTGINRNIVECKCDAHRNLRLLQECINRNIVECKYCSCRSNCSCNLVLIETLWNVNSSPDTTQNIELKVLIETLWNVNITKTVKATCGAKSINRNIVECKSFISSNRILNRTVLIETLWNVNIPGCPR